MAVEVERLTIALEARFDRYDANLRASQTATDRRLATMERRFDRFGKNLRDSTSSAALGVKSALAGIGTYLGARELQQYADGWTTVTRALEANEQVFGLRLRSASDLNKLASEARADLDAYAKLYMRTAAATKELGVAEEDVAKATSTVAMALKLGSATASEQASTMLQLSQAFQKGKLDGDEFRAVMENAGIVQELLAKKLNVTKGALLKMAADGKLVVKDLFAALVDGNAEVSAIFNKMPTTIGESMVVLQNAVTEYVGALDRATAATKAISAGAGATARNMELIGDSVLVAAAGLLAAFGPKLLGLVRAGSVAIAGAAGPFGLLVGAIAAAGTAYAVLADDFAGSHGAMTTTRDQIDAIASILGEKLAPYATRAEAAVTVLATVLGRALTGRDISWDELVGNARSTVNTLIGVMRFAVEAVKIAFSTLPAAIGESFVDGVNRAIRSVEWLVNQVVAAVNHLPGIKLPPVELGGFENTYEGARQTMLERFRAAGREIGRDFLGEASTAVDDFFRDIDRRATEFAIARRFATGGVTVRRTTTEGPKRKDYDGKGKAKKGAFQVEVRKTEEGIRDMQLENQLLGVNAQKTYEAKTALELLNAAKQEGVKITPQLLAQIDELSRKYSAAKTEAERLKATFDEIKSLSADVLKGFITDLKDGKSGTEALSGALDKIANKLIDMAVNQLVQNALGPVIGAALGGGSGGTAAATSVFAKSLTAGASSLPKFAAGGISRTPAIFGEGPLAEAAVPLPDGRRIPVDLRVDSAKAAGGRAGGEVVVRVAASEQLLVDIDNRAEGVVARRAPQIVGAAVGQVDKAIPGMLRKAQKRSL